MPCAIFFITVTKRQLPLDKYRRTWLRLKPNVLIDKCHRTYIGLVAFN